MTEGLPGITIAGMKVAYGRSEPVVAGLDLEIAPGEFRALLGPSGCGKTTLLKALAGLLPVSGGSVDGVGRDDMGYVPQGNSCFPWLSVAENVAYGLWTRGVNRSERRRRALELLESVGLGDQGERYPAKLSEGMRQRVAVARAFALEPGLLLMDEPFSALDYQTKLRVQEELLALWRDHRSTVIYVTHDIDEALLLADRITVLTGRPAQERETFEVPFPRPRTHARIRKDSRYGALYGRCHELLESREHAALA